MLPVSDDTDQWFNQPIELPTALQSSYQLLKVKADQVELTELTGWLVGWVPDWLIGWVRVGD